LKLAAGFPTTEICRAVAAAANTVCTGEILQNKRRNQFSHSREDYFKVLKMKTGELFALSCDLGGYLNGATEDQRGALRNYGMAMGTAYQVFDDCLDLFGTEATVGKSLGTDLAKGKLTLPVLLLLERISAGAREELEASLSRWNVSSYPGLRKQLEGHGVLEDSRRMMREHLGGARRMLETLPPSEGRAGLNRLVAYLDQQMARLGSGRG
jgi:octaprenyl-diphosphate synthase